MTRWTTPVVAMEEGGLYAIVDLQSGQASLGYYDSTLDRPAGFIALRAFGLAPPDTVIGISDANQLVLGPLPQPFACGEFRVSQQLEFDATKSTSYQRN